MQTIQLAGLRFGDGLPKICLPLTGADLPALLAQLEAVRALPADLYEWRMDLFGGQPLAALGELTRQADRPLLCTLRTRDEGGQAAVSREEYESLLLEAIEAGGFQLLDVELSWGPETVGRLIEAAHRKGVGVVCSRHDFQKTPDLSDMVDALTQMKALGADLPKLAVMPNSPQDVLRLMEATVLAYEQVGPVITMSMGALGQLSRVSGGLTGSCLTFGAGVEASAPGQLPAGDLLEIMEILGGRGHEK